MLTKLAREWLPPRLHDYVLQRTKGIRAVSKWPSESLGGWADAAAEAAKGYEEGVRDITAGLAPGFASDICQTMYSGNKKQLHDRLVQFSLVVARTAGGRNSIRILDFGGGFGVHSLAITQLLPHLQCEYCVCDLPSFCEIGQHLNRRVRFVSNLDQAKEDNHLVYASSSLQYVEAWRSVIAVLCRKSTSSVFITRTPFIFHGPTCVTIQSAYKTEYPGWIFNYSEFVQEFPQHGMVLKQVFVNGPGIHVKNMIESNIHLGLLFERQSQSIRSTES